MDGFGKLFGHLESVRHTGGVRRNVGYEGLVGDRREVRFFGVEVDLIEGIPEGMVGLDLQENSWTLHESRGGEDVVTWQGDIAWRWTDAAGSFVGECSITCPGEWATDGAPMSCELRMTTNAYFDRDKDLDDNIYLADYDPAWPAKFEETQAWLREGLGSDIALRIEHYGSTAIPGMPAKPIIDVLVEIPSADAARKRCIPFFNKPECEYWLCSDHVYFMIREKPMGTRTHHIHMAPAGHQLWEGIPFRDYLRTHPDDAARYAALKHDLADRYSNEREKYTDAKHEFVMEVLGKVERV